MRVIAGKFRSRRLRTLRGHALRPTSDRLRETLFNILGAAVEGSVFVDVYAGTGAVGIEALSRGARRVFFIENHLPAVRLIRENLQTLRIQDAAEVLSMEAAEGLKFLAARKLSAQFVFLDPPYRTVRETLQVLEWLSVSRLLHNDGLLIFEHSQRAEMPDRASLLVRVRRIRQGDAILSFYCPLKQ